MFQSLNALEIELLTRAALTPKPTVTWADRKRQQRAAAKARTPEGRMLVTADNINRSLLDAMATAIRSSNLDLTVADILQEASTRFPVPIIAEASIRQRLAARKPAGTSGGQANG